ncbi:P-loop containing nucleoside triphosphate hydrolase protein [Mycena floridula]|nr:P-loop containing nucleoside triphosphate hydrolase protein [Mycena floridula]
MASSATLTTTHLPQLRSILKEWQAEQAPSIGFRPMVAPEIAKDVVVAFRTRPSLPNEAAEKFRAEDNSDDVEFCAGITVTSAEPGIFVAHVPGMKWTGPTLAHKIYSCDLGFGPDIENEEIYERTIKANDVLPLVLSGGIGCVLAYSQTGSGKTYSMLGIESCVARDLFDIAQAVGKKLLSKERGEAIDNEEAANVFEFSVTFLEILGRRVTDLLEPFTALDEAGYPVGTTDIAIREDKLGNVSPKVVSNVVRSSKELEDLIATSLSHRRTSSTLRNANSSRSHAILIIRTKNTLLPYAPEGQLILVDLAGSERYEDSKHHDKRRMDESRENNKTLMNLKDCVKAKAKMAQEDGFVHIPWRASKLTMLLKPIFDIESRQPSRTVIIAHVSPHIQDSVHSVNTLSYAAPFKTSPPKPRGPAPYDAKDPRTWDHLQTHAWFTMMFTKRASAAQQALQKVASKHGKKPNPAPPTIDVDIDKVCPPGMTANNFGVMYTNEFVERCLDSRPSDRILSPRAIDDLKNWSTEIISHLFYLFITAKTRTRTGIMKSRKVLETQETYGEIPEASRAIKRRTAEEFDQIQARLASDQ